MATRLGLWGPVVAYMAFIYFQSAGTQLRSLTVGVSDWMLHVGGYAVLSALFVRALSEGFKKPVTLLVSLLAITFTTLYGASDEYHQSFVPGRQAAVEDFVADAVGACLAALPLYLGFRSPRQRVR